MTDDTQDTATPEPEQTTPPGEQTVPDPDAELQAEQERLQAESRARYEARRKELEGWGREKREAHIAFVLEQQNHFLSLVLDRLTFVCAVLQQATTPRNEAGRIVVPK